MSNPTQMPKRETVFTKVPPPKCPKCGTVLDNVGLFSWGAAPPFQIFAVYCSNEACRVPLHMQLVPVISQEETQQEEPPPSTRIHRVS